MKNKKEKEENRRITKKQPVEQGSLPLTPTGCFYLTTKRKIINNHSQN
ncbi:hypothetical protein SK066_05740 [Paenibacillus hunanensis]|nr:hypothetical protein [Paenibacillus hunanensis]WPP42453.1 hypothetical protein SK066_05740 [Paenibacillus hunanensis]